MPARHGAELLAARARALARPAVADEGEVRELLVARVGDRRIGVPLDRAREVLAEGRVARVPGAPPAIRGLRGVRGELVAVVDPAELLELEPSGGAAQVVVLHHPAEPLGLLVDSVEEVRAWTGAGSDLARDGGGVVAAIIGAAGEEVVVLDCDSLFDDPRLAVGEAVPDAATTRAEGEESE